MLYAEGSILLNRYRLERFLGAGAFAEVYLARHLELDKVYALKVLTRDHPDLGSTEYGDFRQRFRLEAQLGARIEHPNVVQVHDFEDAGDLLLLRMAYAEGGSMAAHLKWLKEERGQAPRQMPVAEALRIAQDVAQGLAALHSLEVVHRDLKPSNILFAADGRAMVADLGLAQVPGGPSQRSLLSDAPRHPGTPDYMSPEQGASSAALSSASDIYALGLVLFEMMAGRRYRSVRPGTPVRDVRPDVPEAVSDLLARMLAREPGERPWDGTEAAGLLQQVRDNAARSEEAQRRQAEAERLRQEQGAAAAVVAAEQARQETLRREQEQTEAERRRREQVAAEKAAPSEQAREETLRRGKEQAKAERRSEGESKSQSRRWQLWLGLVVATAAVVVLLRSFGGSGGTPTPQVAEKSVGVIATAAPETTDLPPAVTIAPTPTPERPTPTPEPPTETPEPPTKTPALAAITVTTSPKDGMEMVHVPAGEFLMGSAADANEAQANEKPQHAVTLDAFWIDRMEVTNSQFARFVAETKYVTDAEKAGTGEVFDGTRVWVVTKGADWRQPWGPGSSNEGDHPVVQVSWNDAKAYCEWAGRRLPTEAEWEMAARGTDGRTYPWGNATPDATLANFGMNVKDTTAVGSYPAGVSPYGALDMAGNVWEWVGDWYAFTYDSSSPAANPVGPETGEYRVLRGGSWDNPSWYVRSAFRLGVRPDVSYGHYGIRCARSASSAPGLPGNTSVHPADTSVTSPSLSASQTVNVRSGPGTTCSALGRLQAGQSYPITGRNQAGDWWRIDNAGATGWVSAGLVSVAGPADAVDAVEVEPCPAPGRGTPIAFQGNVARNYGPPSGSFTTGGVRFAPANDMWTSQNEGHPDYPEKLGVEVNKSGVQKVHLLYSGGSTYFEEPWLGQNAVKVHLGFDDGSEQVRDLIVGQELRDWLCGQCATNSADVREAWSGTVEGRRAVMDMLAIPVEPQHQGRVLQRIWFDDVSYPNITSRDPALNLIAITVE